jgi:hypothetical protein
MASKKIVVTIKRKKYKPRGQPKALRPYQFKPGPDPRRNAHGRPHLTRFDHQLRDLLAEVMNEDGTTTLEVLMRVLIAMGMNGDMDAMKEMIAMVDGPRVSKSVNVGIRAGNAYMNNPAFQDFLEQQLAQFEEKTNVNGQGQGALPEAIEGAAAED